MAALRTTFAALIAAGAVACSTPTLDVTQLRAPAAAAQLAGDPALAREPGSGTLYLAWVGGPADARQVEFARSADGGASWSSPVRVTTEPGDVGPPHGEAAPRIVAGGNGRVAIVWSKSVPVPGRRWPASAIRFARSLDGGASWSGPRTLNDDSTGAPGTHTFHGAAWAGDSGIVAAWLDERGGEAFPGHHHSAVSPDAAPVTESDARIFVAASANFGESWAPNRHVWGAVCPCCRVALARDGAGGIVSAWRQHLPGNVRDVVTAPIVPVAADPIRVHEDDWEYPGCPHTGPGLAIGADGVRHVAWYTGKTGREGVYYARVDSTGAAQGEPVAVVTAPTVRTAHSSVAALPDGGALVATDVGTNGGRAIRIARISADGRITGAVTIPGSADGSYPQLTLAGEGSAVVAWTAPEGESGSVRLARVAAGSASR
jgi:hypothetical protein